MAHVELTVPAPPETVHRVLADGWTYGGWMVGAGHVEDVDSDWPAPGSRIRHKSGLGKASLHGETVVSSTGSTPVWCCGRRRRRWDAAA